MDKQTEENINRYIRYRLGPPKFLLGFALCFAVGCTLLIFGPIFWECSRAHCTGKALSTDADFSSHPIQRFGLKTTRIRIKSSNSKKLSYSAAFLSPLHLHYQIDQIADFALNGAIRNIDFALQSKRSEA